MKRCTKCGLNKRRSEFYVRRASRDGKQYRCRTCVHEANGTLRPLWRRRRKKRAAWADRREALVPIFLKPFSTEQTELRVAEIHREVLDDWGTISRRQVIRRVKGLVRYGALTCVGESCHTAYRRGPRFDAVKPEEVRA